MSDPNPVIAWFRQDLRIADNPALIAACRTGAPVLPVYVLDDDSAGDWRMGAASRWWLHASLASLDEALAGHLVLLTGNAAEVIPELVEALDATAVFWNRCYEPWRIARDTRIKAALRKRSVSVHSTNGSLLWEPPDVLKPDGTPYRVFTPYYRKGCLENGPQPREPLAAPTGIRFHDYHRGANLDDLGLLPEIDWYSEMAEAWSPGERGARDRLAAFIEHGLDGYDEGRNYPDQANASRLSPHLHFGEISPNEVWHAIRKTRPGTDSNADRFLSEIGWREFSYYLLYHEPSLPERNLQRKFDRMQWRHDAAVLTRWQRGRTGIPIVDAGMRQLWRTGYMHNRVRMIVASLLVKNLQHDWRDGARWFWDTLLDADLASNSASWQWVAGTGADAAPYFRIFNPVTQGRKFDPGGRYVRQYVPEVSALPDKYVHSPWEAPADILEAAGIELGRDYPEPLVDLKESRERALASFHNLTG